MLIYLPATSRELHLIPLAAPLRQASQVTQRTDRDLHLSALLSRHLESSLIPFRSTWNHLSNKAAIGFGKFGSRVNDVSGYGEVELLKSIVLSKDSALTGLREHARIAKVACDDAISARSTTQRDVNTLLERKHSWTEDDVSRFTSLVRSDHAWSSAVTAASSRLVQAELSVDRAFTELTQAILTRYHEEQVWSDKIRSVSTYANLAGLLVNLAVFIGAFAIVEPWKRRRLVERLEEHVAGMMTQISAGVASLASKLDGPENQRAILVQETESTPQWIAPAFSMFCFRPLFSLADPAYYQLIWNHIYVLHSAFRKQDREILTAVAATLAYGLVAVILSWAVHAFR